MIPAFVKELGNTSNKTAGTTLALTTTGATTAGNLIVARVLFDNFTTASKPIVSSITKMAGETNNWVFLGAARSTNTTAGSFVSGEMWCIQTTVAWAAAAYTVTLDSSVTQKAMAFTEYSGASATQRSTAGTNYSTTTTAASATTTGTTPVTNDLVLGFVFQSNSVTAAANDTDTTSGSWAAMSGLSFGSTGGNVATNNWGNGTYKILTSGAHQTLNSSAALTAGNGAVVAILQSIPDPTLTQASYRFYGDGTETSSTALAAQDTAPTVDVSSGDVNLQLRTRIQVTANAGQPGDDYQLQWEKNASGTWTDVIGGSEVLTDSYPISNRDSSNTMSASLTQIAQSFKGDGRFLARAGMALHKNNSTAGSFVAVLYAHSGTYGTAGALPTGPALVTSTTTISYADIANAWGMYYFTFDGSFNIVSGTPYFIAVQSVGATSTLAVGNDASSPTHAGSGAAFSGSWSAQAADYVFEVYSSSPASTVVPFDSTNLTDVAATTNRLTGGTGTFVAGEISETGVVSDLAITANNYTELLYSLTLKSADLAHGDTLRFRVLRNGVTTGLTYTQTPTINVSKVVTNPKIETLTDDFSGTLAKWPDTYGTVSIASGQAKITASTGYPAMCTSPNVYDLTDSAIYAKLTMPNVAGGGSREMSMEVRIDGNNKVMFLCTGLNLMPWKVVGGSSAQVTSTPYSPTNHAWLKISHTTSPNLIRWSSSPDGINWTELTNLATPFAITSMDVVFSAGWWGTETAWDMYIDNVNVSQAPTGGRPKVWTGSTWAKKPAKVWTGSAWVTKPVKVWTGSTWKTLA